jgi:GINS complex subunit 1
MKSTTRLNSSSPRIKMMRKYVISHCKNNRLVFSHLAEESRVLENISYIPTVKIRHAAIKRNLRCLLAYHYNRIKCLKAMRWQFGSILPPDVKVNLSQSEIEWFSKYSNSLVQYMRTIGEGGINLAVDLKPPKICVH